MVDYGGHLELQGFVQELVAEVLELEPEEVKPELHFIKDLGMDSMMALEILAGIEKKYRIAIPEEALPQFVDLNKTVEIVEDILKKS